MYVVESGVDLKRLVEVQKMEEQDMHYMGYDGAKVSHSCEHMMNGYEANFCDDVLYYLTSAPDLDYLFSGWTYVCGVHLNLGVLNFAVRMEDKLLDTKVDEWHDFQLKLEM